MKKGFFDLGLDSLTALELKKTLERDLGTELSTTVAFDYPTPEALSQFLASKVFKPKEAVSYTHLTLPTKRIV